MCEIPYQLVRTKRKTLVLMIHRDAQLIVRAPLRLSETVIHDFIRKKARWIAAKQREVADFGGKQSAFVLKDGERVLYLGNAYTILRKMVPGVTLDGHCMHIPEDMTLDGFARWMREQGDGVIRERVNHYANQMGLRYTAVRMSGAKHRWGSCGAKNTLNFAWRLVMCPQSVIDYVVVHELSHIPYKGHGVKFWTCVATVMPNYKDAQKWLRHNRKLLEII